MSIAVAVILPCYNEAQTIGRTIASIRQTLPEAAIWVCDNNSTDDTAAAARSSGATVITERAQGKGSAVRRLFTAVEADIYVLIDGDDTYDISRAPAMIAMLVDERLAMVTGTRQDEYARAHPIVVAEDKVGDEVGTRDFVPEGSTAQRYQPRLTPKAAPDDSPQAPHAPARIPGLAPHLHPE